jgi:hypothetical protein
MKALQYHDLLKHYMAIMNYTMAIRIRTFWLEQEVPLGDLYKYMIKEFTELKVDVPSFTEDRKIDHNKEGSTLILTAMLFLNEAYKASIWNKYKNGFEEKEKQDNMTLGEYRAELLLKAIAR